MLLIPVVSGLTMHPTIAAVVALVIGSEQIQKLEPKSYETGITFLRYGCQEDFFVLKKYALAANIPPKIIVSIIAAMNP